jgi:hypothetical protein
MQYTGKAPDGEVLLTGKPDSQIAWAIVGQRLVSARRYGHPGLMEQHYGDDPSRMDNSGYVITDRIVAWIEPTVKQLDILWKEFGCLDVEYCESLADSDCARIKA